MKKILTLLVLVGVGLTLTMAQNVKADIYTFDYNNLTGVYTGTDPDMFGTITLTSVIGGIDITLAASSGFSDASVTDLAAWKTFVFNVDPSVSSTIVEAITATINGADVGITFYPNNSYSEFGRFVVDLTGLTDPKLNILGNDPLTIHLATSLSLAQIEQENSDGWMFAGHLIRIDSTFNDGTEIDFGEGVTSLWLGSGGAPVPEPATMLLFGTGLVGLAGVARRKRS